MSGFPNPRQVVFFQDFYIFLYIFCSTLFLLVDGLPNDQLLNVHRQISWPPTPQAWLMLKSFYSGVSDVRSMHYDSTETEDPLLGVVNHFIVSTILGILYFM